MDNRIYRRLKRWKKINNTTNSDVKKRNAKCINSSYIIS